MARYIRKNISYRIVTIGFIFLIALFFHTTLFAEINNSQSLVTVLTIDGAIGPAVQAYVDHGIHESEKLHAKAIDNSHY